MTAATTAHPPPVSDPHPSEGCGLCGWDGPEDTSPCPAHAADVAGWESRNGWAD
jgi:hypothetical protein